ncbi:uncharacterized protein BT62DRAFT_254001 [Guyanagaster necrorhizus]|uniref:Uncharacterized protein n=1 Tax=Guyanagaster necrorhizus TaxID=856835 RepID=A0A9P7VP61_9AGAR|nr:uncharacterized protein BT62DRAFT_254001 [Guyanagaster necrorhizus MCA 3950]KAG7444145.1 hypothetical protein BT62DRAFT_254001 [Guyanagaster necrorhizus MCA 3950]
MTYRPRGSLIYDEPPALGPELRYSTPQHGEQSSRCTSVLLTPGVFLFLSHPFTALLTRTKRCYSTNPCILGLSRLGSLASIVLIPVNFPTYKCLSPDAWSRPVMINYVIGILVSYLT